MALPNKSRWVLQVGESYIYLCKYFKQSTRNYSWTLPPSTLMANLKASSTFKIPLRSLHLSSSWPPQPTAWSKQPRSHLSCGVCLIISLPHHSYSTLVIHSPRSSAVASQRAHMTMSFPSLKASSSFPFISG